MYFICIVSLSGSRHLILNKTAQWIEENGVGFCVALLIPNEVDTHLYSIVTAERRVDAALAPPNADAPSTPIQR